MVMSRPVSPQPQTAPQRRVVERSVLYVGVPGLGADISHGGVGILAFDTRAGHRFIKRIPTWDYPASRAPEDIRGVAASAATGLLYVSTPTHLAAIDLTTDKMVWDQAYDGECCDRMAVSPDGRTIYAPAFRGSATFAGKHWYVIDAATGNLIKKLPTPESDGSHNTVWSLDGSRVFMEGLRSAIISVADPAEHTVVQTIGPFGGIARPFVVNGRATLLFANVNELLGFEIADVRSGKVIHRVEVKGFGWSPDRIVAHGMPSHGIALSPDEKEVWISDGANGTGYLHIFDATVMPPKQVKSIKTRDLPGWITFGIDGKYVYPSSGDVIDAATKAVVAGLRDEFGAIVQSEKLVEVLFADGKPVRAVDQLSIGRVR
jgi:hypothetical protein